MNQTTAPRMVPLATRLESHDQYEVWVLEFIAARMIVRTHPVADCGMPRERYVAVTDEAAKSTNHNQGGVR